MTLFTFLILLHFMPFFEAMIINCDNLCYHLKLFGYLELDHTFMHLREGSRIQTMSECHYYIIRSRLTLMLHSPLLYVVHFFLLLSLLMVSESNICHFSTRKRHTLHHTQPYLTDKSGNNNHGK